MDLKLLTKQIPAKWRIQQFSKNKPQASCVAYIDARDAMKILDEVVGPLNWQDDYKMVGDTRFAGVGIKVNNNGWVWKWDTGGDAYQDTEKGEVSDSFKRACVKWGIGRFLYDIDPQYVTISEIKREKNAPHPIDEAGARVWDLSKYLNSRFIKK